MELIDQGEVPQTLLGLPVVGRGMERTVRPTLRIGTGGDIARQLEREHPGHVGLERQSLQIEHQLHVLPKRVRNACRSRGDLPFLTARVALHDLLDSPLDLADAAQILVHSPAVARSEVSLQCPDLLRDPVEKAALGLQPNLPFLRRRSSSEELLEGDPRVPDHWEGLLGRLPADVVRIHACIAVLASAGRVDVLDAELHRGYRRLMADALGEHLVQGLSDVNIGALRVPRVALGQEDGAGAEMVAADLVGGKRLGHFHVRVGDDRQIVPERFERRDAGRAEVEVTAQAGRAPQVQLLPQRCGSGGTVYVLDANQPRTIVLGQDTRAEPARRNHGVEEGERDSRAHASEEGASSNVTTGQDVHLFVPLFP